MDLIYACIVAFKSQKVIGLREFILCMKMITLMEKAYEIVLSLKCMQKTEFMELNRGQLYSIFPILT